MILLLNFFTAKLNHHFEFLHSNRIEGVPEAEVEVRRIGEIQVDRIQLPLYQAVPEQYDTSSDPISAAREAWQDSEHQNVDDSDSSSPSPSSKRRIAKEIKTGNKLC